MGRVETAGADMVEVARVLDVVADEIAAGGLTAAPGLTGKIRAAAVTLRAVDATGAPADDQGAG